MSSIPSEVTKDAGTRHRFEDAEWIDAYLKAGSPHSEPIYLRVGKTRLQAPGGLIRLPHEKAPAHVQGYVLSQDGLPALQRVLHTYTSGAPGFPAPAPLARISKWPSPAREPAPACPSSGDRSGGTPGTAPW